MDSLIVPLVVDGGPATGGETPPVAGPKSVLLRRQLPSVASCRPSRAALRY